MTPHNVHYGHARAMRITRRATLDTAFHGHIHQARCDGTLDVSRWARPQNDGHLDAPRLAEVTALIRFDLDLTLGHWREPPYDIWEEESGHHYYTLRVSAAALAEGAAWLQGLGETVQAQRCREESQAVLSLLDDYWVNNRDATHGYYRSRVLADDRPSPTALDIAVILSAIHSLGTEATHRVADPRMQATLARLDALFDAAYPINHGRAAGRGPAMGRYAGDVYYSGGAYYFSTLGAAEFCFRAAALGGERGDAYLATVGAHTPAGGDLSEQFDLRSGAQTSAKHLAWSHPAFISSVSARRIATACQAPRRR